MHMSFETPVISKDAETFVEKLVNRRDLPSGLLKEEERSVQDALGGSSNRPVQSVCSVPGFRVFNYPAWVSIFLLLFPNQSNVSTLIFSWLHPDPYRVFSYVRDSLNLFALFCLLLCFFSCSSFYC